MKTAEGEKEREQICYHNSGSLELRAVIAMLWEVLPNKCLLYFPETPLQLVNKFWPVASRQKCDVAASGKLLY